MTFQQSPKSSKYCVGLLDVKPVFELEARHQNKIQKVFLRLISAQQISGKNSESKLKTAMKSFSKMPLMYKINTHNISGLRN